MANLFTSLSKKHSNKKLSNFDWTVNVYKHSSLSATKKPPK